MSVTIGDQFSPAEKSMAAKALCLVQKLYGQSIYYPYYSDLYWGTISGTPINCVTMPTGSNNENWVFIASYMKPNGEKYLQPMVSFGITLAHEFDHYYTGSNDDPPNGPSYRLDNPVLDSMNTAIGTKLACYACLRHSPIWRPANLLEKYACDCDINVGN